MPEEELHTTATWIELGEELSKMDAPMLEQALVGISNVLRHLVPMFVMCDRTDIHVVPQMKAPHSGMPTIFLYDRYPGGIGLSEAVFERYDEIMGEVKHLLERCPCENGCPSCIGVIEASNHSVKKNVISFLHKLLSK